MKILFIGITENDTIRGVERYCLELLRTLSTNYSNKISITMLAGKWQTYYNELKNLNINFIYYDGKNNKFARHYFLATKIKKISKNFDIIHYGNTMPILFKNDALSIVTIHDIAEYFIPDKYSFIQKNYRKLMVKQIANKVDKIITVSKYSQKSICNVLKIAESKVIPIYSGIEHFFYKNNKIKDNFKYKTENYFLYWSVIEKSKGIEETVEAFEKFLDKNESKNFYLIVIGKPGNAYKYFESKSLLNKNIIYKGFVDDDELISYIKYARAVLFPSKYEGFGFPALEAFIFNDNVITSNTTSLGEITNCFAWQVNPYDIMDIVEKMQSTISNPKKFSDKEKKNILSNYNWNDCSNKVFKVYNELLGEI